MSAAPRPAPELAPPPPMWKRVGYAVTMLAAYSYVLGHAVWLRARDLGGRSLWFDESVSAAMARLSWHDFIQALWNREANMALYYLLFRPWTQLFGDSEVTLRLFSVVAGLATILVLFWLGRRLFGTAAGVCAAILLTVSQFHVYYSRESRGYALAALLVTLATLQFVRAVQQSSGHRLREWLLYAALSVAAIYTHVFAALVIVAHFASLSWLSGARRRMREFARTAFWIILGCIPLALAVQHIGNAPVRWIAPTSWSAVREFLFLLSGNGGWLLLAETVGVAVIGGVTGIQLRQAFGEEGAPRWHYMLLMNSVVVPLAIALLASIFQPVFLPRYLLICLPAFVLLIGTGISRFEVPQAFLFALALQWSLATPLAPTRVEERQDWRSAAAFVVRHAQPGDAAVFYPTPGRAGFEYYRARMRGNDALPRVVFPAHGDQLSYRDLLVTPLAEEFAQAPRDYRRLWIILADLPSGPDLGGRAVETWFSRGCQAGDTRAFPGIHVVLKNCSMSTTAGKEKGKS